MPEVTHFFTVEYLRALGADVVFVSCFYILLVSWGLTKGKRVLIALLLSLYPALLSATAFPWYQEIAFTSATTAPLVLFGVTVVGFFVMLRGYLYTTFPPSGIWRFVEVAVLSLGVTGLAASSAYSLGLGELYSLSTPLEQVFNKPLAVFLWSAGPLVALPLLVRP